MYQVSISIIIPVYNTWKTIGISLDSLIDQTFRDIEIICIDDGSNEETKAVLSEYARIDNRIQVITLPENRGALYARSKGIDISQGRYIMFLDGDDEYVPSACERAYAAITELKVDILQYGTKVVAEENVSQQRIDEFKKYMANPGKKLLGKDVFKECFTYGEMRYGWHLWNKIFNAEVLKKSVSYTPEERCVIATDFYLYFIAAYNAKSFGAIDDELICYKFGDGVSTTRAWSLDVFSNNLTRKVACNAIQNFLDHQKNPDKIFIEEFNKWEDDYLRVCVWNFVKNCKLSYGKEAFDLLVKAYSLERVVEKIVAVFGSKETVRVARLIYGAKCLNVADRKTKTVAFFYHRFSNGGVQRVLSKLIPLFIEWGYKTVLFVEEESEDDYKIPDSCKKCILPSSLYGVSNEQYIEHSRSLFSAIKENKVDVLLYQATSATFFLYDILTAKAAGAKVVGTMHELLAQPLLRSYETYTRKLYVYRIADGMQTLLRSDLAYLRSFGINAEYIPNPATYEPITKVIEQRENNILWVGRLEEVQKQAEQAILIMEEVIRLMPDTHMFIVGKGVTDAVDTKYQNLAISKGLANNITFVGYLDDPKEYYRKCGVLLITSLFEVSPMVLGEALSNGMPVVAYDMPYVEFLRSGAGVQCVEQRDKDAAASALVNILQDSELQRTMSEQSLKVALSFSQMDLCKAWATYLHKLIFPKKTKTDDNMQICLENMLEFYDFGIANRMNDEKRKDLKIKAEKESLMKQLAETNREFQQNAQVADTQLLNNTNDGQSMGRRLLRYWVEKGTFATMRKGLVYICKKVFKGGDDSHNKFKYSFSNYVALGYNRETDFRLIDHLALKKNSANFITVPWAYSFNPSKLVDALKNPDDILSGEIEVSESGDATFKDLKYDLVLPLSGHKASEFYSETGIKKKLAIDEGVKSLKETCHEFSRGINKVYASDKATLYIVKAKSTYSNFSWINELFVFLKKMHKKENFSVLIVVEKRVFDALNESKVWQRNRRIILACVQSFASDSNVKNGGDLLGWAKVLNSVEKLKLK